MNEFDFDVTEIKWNSQGLVPAIVQEGNSGEVLMLAWVNKEAWRSPGEKGSQPIGVEVVRSSGPKVLLQDTSKG